MLWNALICTTVLMLLSEAYTKGELYPNSNYKKELYNAVSDFDHVLEPVEDGPSRSYIVSSNAKPIGRRSSREKHFSRDDSLKLNSLKLDNLKNSKIYPFWQYKKLTRNANLLSYKNFPVGYQTNFVKSNHNQKSAKRFAAVHHGLGHKPKTDNVANFENKAVGFKRKGDHSKDIECNVPLKNEMYNRPANLFNNELREVQNDKNMEVEKHFKEKPAQQNFNTLPKLARAPWKSSYEKYQSLNNHNQEDLQMNGRVPHSTICYPLCNHHNVTPAEVNKQNRDYLTENVTAKEPLSITLQNGNSELYQTLSQFSDITHDLANSKNYSGFSLPQRLSANADFHVVTFKTEQNVTPDNIVEEDAAIQIFQYHRKKVNYKQLNKTLEKLQSQQEKPINVDSRIGNIVYKIDDFPKSVREKSAGKSRNSIESTEGFEEQTKHIFYVENPKSIQNIVLLKNPDVDESLYLNQQPKPMEDYRNVQEFEYTEPNFNQIDEVYQPSKAVYGYGDNLQSIDLSHPFLNMYEYQTSQSINEVPQAPCKYDLYAKRHDLPKSRHARFSPMRKLDKNSKFELGQLKRSPLQRRVNAKTYKPLYRFISNRGRDLRNSRISKTNDQRVHEFILKPLPPQGFNEVNNRIFRGIHGSHRKNVKQGFDATKIGNKVIPASNSIKVKRNVDSTKDLYGQANRYMKQAYKLLDDLEKLGKHVKSRSSYASLTSFPEHVLDLRDIDSSTTYKTTFDDGFHVQLNPELLQKIDAIRLSIQNAMHPISIVKLHSPNANYLVNPNIMERLNELRANIEQSINAEISTSNTLVDSVNSVEAKSDPVSRLFSVLTTPTSTSGSNSQHLENQLVYNISPKVFIDKKTEKKASNDINYNYDDDYLDDSASKLKREVTNSPDSNDSSDIFRRLQHQVCALKALDLQSLKKIREHMNSIQALINASTRTLVTPKSQTLATIRTFTYTQKRQLDNTTYTTYETAYTNQPLGVLQNNSSIQILYLNASNITYNDSYSETTQTTSPIVFDNQNTSGKTSYSENVDFSNYSLVHLNQDVSTPLLTAQTLNDSLSKYSEVDNKTHLSIIETTSDSSLLSANVFDFNLTNSSISTNPSSSNLLNLLTLTSQENNISTTQLTAPNTERLTSSLDLAYMDENNKNETDKIMNHDKLFEEKILRTILEVYHYLMLFRSSCPDLNNVSTSDESSSTNFSSKNSFNDNNVNETSTNSINDNIPHPSLEYSHRIRDTTHKRQTLNINETLNQTDNQDPSETASDFCNDTIIDTTSSKYLTSDHTILQVLRNSTLETLTSGKPEETETECHPVTVCPAPALMPNSSSVINTPPQTTSELSTCTTTALTTHTLPPATTTTLHKLEKYSILLQALLNSKIENHGSEPN